MSSGHTGWFPHRKSKSRKERNATEIQHRSSPFLHKARGSQVKSADCTAGWYKRQDLNQAPWFWCHALAVNGCQSGSICGVNELSFPGVRC